MVLRWIGALSVAAMAWLAAGCSEQNHANRDIDPRAHDALRKMSAEIGGARSFSFAGTLVMDEPVAPGQNAQLTRKVKIAVRRPDRVFVECDEGGDLCKVWYSGGTLNMLDGASKSYAVLSVPGRIDAMLDDVAKRDGLTFPLADFIMSDPYRALTADTLTGRYVEQCELDGVACDHLLFTQELIDWQIWIASKGQRVPLRFVIDYKNLRTRPQFTAQLSDWNLHAPTTGTEFTPQLPPDGKKVDLKQLRQTIAQGASS